MRHQQQPNLEGVSLLPDLVSLRRVMNIVTAASPFVTSKVARRRLCVVAGVEEEEELGPTQATRFSEMDKAALPRRRRLLKSEPSLWNQ
jgi:hypothetical protein